MGLLFLEKAGDVKKPGSRGGHPWIDEHFHWRYDERPTDKRAPASAAGPEVAPTATDAPKSGTIRPAGTPKNPLDYKLETEKLMRNAQDPALKKLPETEDDWRKDQLARLGEPLTSKRKIGFAPTRAMEWAKDPSGVTKLIDGMDPQVRQASIDGLMHVEKNMDLQRRHAMTGRNVLLHFCWAILAKSSEPYTQESAYIDLEHSGINYFIDKTLEGKFDLDEYKAWLGEGDANVLRKDAEKKGYLVRPPGNAKAFKGLASGSPGRQVTMNVNIIGKMLEGWSDRGTQGLVDLFNNPDISGKDARREFWRRGYGGGGVGLNNKILSFAIAMLGKPDVMVMDIWQARQFHPEAFKRLYAQYKREAEQGKRDAQDSGDARNVDPDKDMAWSKATSDVQSPYNNPGGPAGVTAYEGLENLLAKAIKGLPVEKNGKIGGKVTPSVFALHWLSWVAMFNSAVSHTSLDTPVALAQAGLSSRPQQRDKLSDPPTADDRLTAISQTEVTQGKKKLRTYMTTYRRGTVKPADVKYKASFVPTEFVPGSFPSQFGDWLKQQSPEVRGEYSFEASRNLEPTFRKIAQARGLALSVNEGWGGFGGSGNANSQATLVPLEDGMSDEDTQKAVLGFAADLGWAFKQDMAVTGHMVPPGTADAKTGYDVQLSRSLSPEEVQSLGEAAKAAMEEGIEDEEARKDSDAGFSVLPNNVVRFINFTEYSKAPMDDAEYLSRIQNAVAKGVPDALDRDQDGSVIMNQFGWEGDAVSNDWEEDPNGGGYDEARQVSSAAVQGGRDSGAGQDMALRLRQSLDSFNTLFQAQHGGKAQEEVTKSMGALLFLEKALPHSPVHHNHGPGSRGGVGFYDKNAHWQYGERHNQNPNMTPSQNPNRWFHKLGNEAPISTHQPWTTEGDLYAHANEAAKQLVHMLTGTRGMASTLGMKVFRPGHKPTPLDYATPGGFIMIAPLKGKERSEEKVNKDYAGDWSNLLDVVRATIAVDDVPHLWAVATELRHLGATIARTPKNRFTNPTDVGYRDALLNIKLPNGMIAEVQLHLKPVLEAKAKAHQYYEVSRTIEADAKLRGGSMSEDESARLQSARDAQKQLYAEAWKRAAKSEYLVITRTFMKSRDVSSEKRDGEGRWTRADFVGKWAADTAYKADGWDEACPEKGQCAVTALVLQKKYGGDIVRAKVGRESHYYNILPQGEKVDLTIGQFPFGSKVVPLKTADRKQLLGNEGVRRRYETLEARMNGSLGKSHDVSTEPRDDKGKWTNNGHGNMAGKRGLTPDVPYWVYLNLHLGTKKPLVSKKTGLPIKDLNTGKIIMVPDHKIWSMKNTKTGLVDEHRDTVYLKNVKMHIGQGGRRRVIIEGKKNVHAGVVGKVVDVKDVPQDGWLDLHYNPKEHPEMANGFFVLADAAHPDQRISHAEYARFTPSGTQIIGPKYIKGKHDDDLYTGI